MGNRWCSWLPDILSFNHCNHWLFNILAAALHRFNQVKKIKHIDQIADEPKVCVRNLEKCNNIQQLYPGNTADVHATGSFRQRVKDTVQHQLPLHLTSHHYLLLCSPVTTSYSFLRFVPFSLAFVMMHAGHDFWGLLFEFSCSFHLLHNHWNYIIAVRNVLLGIVKRTAYYIIKHLL